MMWKLMLTEKKHDAQDNETSTLFLTCLSQQRFLHTGSALHPLNQCELKGRLKKTNQAWPTVQTMFTLGGVSV